ncbi:MAG: hypothetical protein FWF49_01125, partial [Oscillospiraceae bacterium]|nr:hypothetical protein [Oscillospiraceae bacterium]
MNTMPRPDGFLEYNLKWYCERLDTYESMVAQNVTADTLHEAKVLHKFLEDIRDEGYRDTYEAFQIQDATRRLAAFLKKNHAQPFRDMEQPRTESMWVAEETALQALLDTLTDKVDSASCDGNIVAPQRATALRYLLRFSRWVYDSMPPDAAAVFMLRDTLLPYLAFQYWNRDGRKTAMPLLIGRAYLAQFGDDNAFYDRISDAVYKALQKTANPVIFQVTAAQDIKNVINGTALYKTTCSILSDIRQPSLCVIESGAQGIIPMLLKSCDVRVGRVYMYTTLPWLYSAWEGSFFTKRYEDLRVLETLDCQSGLFSFSSMKKNTFYIRRTADAAVSKRAMEELRGWQTLVSAEKTLKSLKHKIRRG